MFIRQIRYTIHVMVILIDGRFDVSQLKKEERDSLNNILIQEPNWKSFQNATIIRILLLQKIQNLSLVDINRIATWMENIPFTKYPFVNSGSSILPAPVSFYNQEVNRINALPELIMLRADRVGLDTTLPLDWLVELVGLPVLTPEIIQQIQAKNHKT